MDDEKEWLAFVGHAEHRQAGRALRLYCSPECALAAGHKTYQPIRQSRAAESALVGYGDECARCTRPFQTAET